MIIKNLTNRIHYINVTDESGVVSTLSLEGKKTLEDERITEKDVAIYVRKNRVEILDAPAVENTDKKEEPALVVLPENPTVENLVAMAKKDLKLYCKQNKIKGYSDKDEETIANMILESLKPTQE